ncbi:hypothetical protein PA905_30430 [Planktothrix agardhii CCAP 1459/11A]|jgi:NADH:ubiquinone oxidoreductase subunit E|nr:conserved hypothetical protein [Planktothrix rubescens NIVA-CYA 18]CAD5948118.1 Protein TM_1420 [Planktothrix agardhii]CAD5952514.1 Protein TM_1420 [Planktothrix rubescens]GCL34186.1 hypothetical protein PA905_30430 [Planktothrix agardhii CCAP 1459/11A]CAD5914047.1 Protein TM_1420 [Planktothrix rubescens NIVA-CYA 18]
MAKAQQHFSIPLLRLSAILMAKAQQRIYDIRRQKMPKENLYLCMGSACHQLGVYEVLPKLQALMSEYDIDHKIELKGSFCLETCSSGIVMKFKDLHFINISPQNIEDRFLQEILPAIKDQN